MNKHNAVPDRDFQKAMQERRRQSRRQQKQERQSNDSTGKVQRTDKPNSKR